MQRVSVMKVVTDEQTNPFITHKQRRRLRRFQPYLEGTTHSERTEDLVRTLRNFLTKKYSKFDHKILQFEQAKNLKEFDKKFYAFHTKLIKQHKETLKKTYQNWVEYRTEAENKRKWRKFRIWFYSTLRRKFRRMPKLVSSRPPTMVE